MTFLSLMLALGSSVVFGYQLGHNRGFKKGYNSCMRETLEIKIRENLNAVESATDRAKDFDKILNESGIKYSEEDFTKRFSEVIGEKNG